jgi:YD repeat-containing protein
MPSHELASVFRDVAVEAVLSAPTPDDYEEVAAVTGRVFVAASPEQFTYDADGNMTSDGRFHYFWNGENRLVCASNAEVVVTYAYDHRGRMVRKEISRGGAEARRIEYLWDDWNIIRETLTTNHYSLTTDYVWGLDLDGTLQGAGGVGGLLAVVKSDCTATNSNLYPLTSNLFSHRHSRHQGLRHL